MQLVNLALFIYLSFLAFDQAHQIIIEEEIKTKYYILI